MFDPQNLPVLITGTIFIISFIFLIVLWIIKNKKEGDDQNITKQNPTPVQNLGGINTVGQPAIQPNPTNQSAVINPPAGIAPSIKPIQQNTIPPQQIPPVPMQEGAKTGNLQSIDFGLTSGNQKQPAKVNTSIPPVIPNPIPTPVAQPVPTVGKPIASPVPSMVSESKPPEVQPQNPSVVQQSPKFESVISTGSIGSQNINPQPITPNTGSGTVGGPATTPPVAVPPVLNTPPVQGVKENTFELPSA